MVKYLSIISSILLISIDYGEFMKELLSTLVFLTIFLSQAYATDTYCSEENSESINIVILQYVTKNTAVLPENVSVDSEKCAGSFGTAVVHSTKPVTDDALVFLKKTEDNWEVISIGTSFDKEFLATIPKVLRN